MGPYDSFLNMSSPDLRMGNTLAIFIFSGDTSAAIDLFLAIAMRGANAFGLSLMNFISVLLNPLEEELFAFLLISSVASMLI